MSNANAPFYPIIYVRGYAASQAEIDATTADPFCGFNLGSTVYRATPRKEDAPKKFVFESPLVRLCSDFGYTDIYEDGYDIVDPEWKGSIPAKSVIIYRYYDEASKLLGIGETPPITEFASRLGDLILKVRDLVCGDPKNAMSKASFRCYLVAHSMGGLVCRAFLQNPKLGTDEARSCVDKVFTYATPHNGIEMAGVNVPSWFGANDANNFSRKQMAGYLNLKAQFAKTERVDWLPEKAFASEKFFCMVGTNRMDYEAAMGLSRTFVGHGSDGLVRIDNASVWGCDNSGKTTQPCATAYAYRSHSGYYGIVNSEEAYQNLIRFLFGTVRVDVWVDIDTVVLPPDVQKQAAKGREVDGTYQFEILVGLEGARWLLTRRRAEEDSVACRSHQEIVKAAKWSATHIHMSTVFLGDSRPTSAPREPSRYSLFFNIRMPDYEVERAFWPDGHYEGGKLFSDALTIEIAPPLSDNDTWTVKYDWHSDKLGAATQSLKYSALANGKIAIEIPFGDGTAPSVNGNLRFVVSAWNKEKSGN